MTRQPLLLLMALPLLATMEARPVDAELRGDATDWLLPLPELDADAGIPPSKDVLGYAWAEEISSHHQIEKYLKALADAAPERTKLVEYGRSSEGRSLNYLVISSRQNIARLEEIRSTIRQLADPRTTDSRRAGELVAGEDTAAIVWLAYAVHGNEISPSDAALLTAYHLLADQRPETQAMLDRLVVIVDPLQNPDGRDRFVNVYRETRGMFNQSNPYANEHTERWPGGRSNHYWFDMNRDWFRQSQREVRAKVAAYLDWQPQIYVDAHEMGRNSTFYFPPPAEPKNPYLLSPQSDWFLRLGKHQAGWFDRFGFEYMTREIFDAFYPGYGSEWPTLQGGLGVLWEQASSRGLVVDRDDETQLSYADGVRHHYISGIATLEFAGEHRRELLQSFYDARQRSIQLGSEGPVKHYFLLKRNRPQRADLLARVLAQNGIEVRVLTDRLEIACAHTKNDVQADRVIPSGSFHIPVAQPAGRLLRTLMDRDIDMDERFLRRQLERNQLRLPDEIYDVTAWSLPLAFDVPCLTCGDVSALQSSLWKPNDTKAAPELKEAKVAYLIRGTDGAIWMLSRLIQQGVRVHVADRGFRIGGERFGSGTLIVKVSQNDDRLHEVVRDTAQDFGVEVVPTDTAFVESGVHMGGPQVQWVRPPSVLLVVNRPTHYSSGHTWYLFDQVLRYPTTRVKGSDLGRVDLRQFNTLVLPDGNYGPNAGFTKERAEKLLRWVEQGGTLILLRGAAQWAADKEIQILKNKIVERPVQNPRESDELNNSDDNHDSGEDRFVPPDSAPGAFLRTAVFQEHWVTFGCDPTLDVFYAGRLILSPTGETAGRSLVTFAERDKLLTSGFCWPANLDLMAGTPYVVYRQVGRGHVVGFTDDPNFRAMYPALQRLFINAAMFGAAH